MSIDNDVSRMAETDKRVEQQALSWLSRRHAGGWSTADEEALADWLAANPAHSQAWLQANGLWNRLADLRELASTELLAARQPPGRSRYHWIAGLTLAASSALSIALLPTLLPGSLSGPQLEETARGEIRTLTLADGSSITLDAASRLEIDYGLSCRCLRLRSGAAIFSVAHGDPRAFTVDAGPGNIRDIGTEFMVRRQGQETLVAVISGEIDVMPGSGNDHALLHAGERLSYSGSGKLLPPPDNSAGDLTAWREGHLVFHDTPLPAVLTEFARYHDITIDIDSRLKNYNLSGSFASADLNALLNLLQAAYPVSIQRPSHGHLSLQLKGPK